MVLAGQKDRNDEARQVDWATVLLLARESTAHKEWFVKTYVIQRLAVIPGSAAAESTPKRPSRLDNFRMAVSDDPVLFEMDMTKTGFWRLYLEVKRFNDAISARGKGNWRACAGASICV